MPQQAPDGTLDDVQVLGCWNFTLQGDTPLYWLRTGQLDRYLLKFRIHSPSPSTCGFVLHAEVDGPGTDGASFWVERRPGRKEASEGSRRYMLAGEGLESKPIVTRPYPDAGGDLTEDVEILMEGYGGTIFLQERKVVLRFRTKHNKGSVAFYNSTQGEKDEVHFGGVRLTALRRGPLEVAGPLLKRERALDRFAAQGALEEAEDRGHARATPKGSTFSAFGALAADSHSSTTAPDPWAPRMGSTMTMSSTFGGGSPELRSSLGRQSLPSPAGSGARSPMQLAGRNAAPQARLQLSASDGALRKTLGSFSGGSAALRRAAGGGRSGDRWIPLAVNAPAGEQQLLKTITRPTPNARACNDFIAM